MVKVLKTGPVACAYASKYSFMHVDSIMRCIHKYLNVYSARECLNSENYILKLLAVLDRRIGKRTVKKLADNIPNEPGWFRIFILLCTESEGIHCQMESNSKITQDGPNGDFCRGGGGRGPCVGAKC